MKIVTGAATALIVASAQPSVSSAQSPEAVATVVETIPDDDLREFAAIAGRKMVGRPVSGPYPTADKLLLLARDDKGYPAIAASLAYPVRQSLPPPPPGTLAVVRLHQRTETVVPGPTADDLAFVEATRIPLFVIGEWARPAPMWEVAWLGNAVRYRIVGEVGEIGPWRE